MRVLLSSIKSNGHAIAQYAYFVLITVNLLIGEQAHVVTWVRAGRFSVPSGLR